MYSKSIEERIYEEDKEEFMVLLEFIEENDGGLVLTNNKGEFTVTGAEEFIEEILPKVNKVDYIATDFIIVIMQDGTSLKIEAL